MQICVWRSNASDLSWSTKSNVFRNLLLLAFTKQDSHDDGHTNSSILYNCDNTCFLDNLFSRDYLRSTSLENLSCKKVIISKININKLFIQINIHTHTYGCGSFRRPQDISFRRSTSRLKMTSRSRLADVFWTYNVLPLVVNGFFMDIVWIYPNEKW